MKRLSCAGGDAVVLGALCAGLLEAAEPLVAQGIFTQEGVTDAFVTQDWLHRRFEAGARIWLEQFDWGAGAPGLCVLRVEPKYRGEDFGVHYSWHHNGQVSFGVYPVNHKNERTHKVTSGPCRIGKQYGILKRLTGKRLSVNDNIAKSLAEVASGAASEPPGLGVLAFVKTPDGRKAVAYDALALFAVCGEPSVVDKRAAGEVAQVMDVAMVACVQAGGVPLVVYDNEGYLLQAQHHRAAAVWETVSVALACHGVFTSVTLLWFIARFKDECLSKSERRLRNDRRELAEALQYL